MKNYKGSYTMRRDAYWGDYYPFLKFYHSIIGVIKYFFIVLCVCILALLIFSGPALDSSLVVGTDDIIIYLVGGLLIGLSAFFIYVFFTLQEEGIRLKVDRNFMLFEIDQKTLKQE